MCEGRRQGNDKVRGKRYQGKKEFQEGEKEEEQDWEEGKITGNCEGEEINQDEME